MPITLDKPLAMTLDKPKSCKPFKTPLQRALAWRNNSKLAVKYDIGAFDAYTFQFGTNYNEVPTGTVDLTGLGLSLVYTSVIRSTEEVKNQTYANGDTITEI